MAEKMTPEKVWNEFEAACTFKAGLNLYDNVQANENFYIGKQWEGVQANGLPTPVFNFIKRIILYVVASTATDNLKMAASPMSSNGSMDVAQIERITQVMTNQFEALFEYNKLSKQLREFMRNAAVDGDGCIYSWFDPEAETGQAAIITPAPRMSCGGRSGSSEAGSRRSPMRSAASPKRWSNLPTAARYPSPWREVIPLEKLHPLGGRQKQAALADP